MNDIINFTYENANIRTVTTEDGTPLFCGKDVAAALGYTNTTDALKRHCKGVVKHCPLETPGGTQEARFITEGDVYRLIFNSKLPTAEKFEAWVFEEVLPSIRKRGGYLTPEATREALRDPDFIIQLAMDLKEERARATQAEAARAKAEAEIEANAPKVLFADAVASAQTDILIGDLAKILRGNGVDTGQRRLFEWMRTNGYLIRQKGTSWNMPTQKAMDMGLFRVKESTVTHADGHTTVSRTTKVTGRGQTYFVNKLLAHTAED